MLFRITIPAAGLHGFSVVLQIGKNVILQKQGNLQSCRKDILKCAVNGYRFTHGCGAEEHCVYIEALKII